MRLLDYCHYMYAAALRWWFSSDMSIEPAAMVDLMFQGYPKFVTDRVERPLTDPPGYPR